MHPLSPIRRQRQPALLVPNRLSPPTAKIYSLGRVSQYRLLVGALTIGARQMQVRGVLQLQRALVLALGLHRWRGYLRLLLFDLFLYPSAGRTVPSHAGVRLAPLYHTHSHTRIPSRIHTWPTRLCPGIFIIARRQHLRLSRLRPLEARANYLQASCRLQRDTRRLHSTALNLTQ